MRLAINHKPSTALSPSVKHVSTIKCSGASSLTDQNVSFNTRLQYLHSQRSRSSASSPSPRELVPLFQISSDQQQPRSNNYNPACLGRRWMEYQGVNNWDGLLNPLDDKLRNEILRYGDFVEAAYRSFDFDPSSSSYGSCLFGKKVLFAETGFLDTGYRLTKNLRATSGIELPRWAEKGMGGGSWWMTMQSSWIGYVAVCQDRKEIERLGRRDVVIAFRGTATCLEWLENLRANLSPVQLSDSSYDENAKNEAILSPGGDGGGSAGSVDVPMVEKGFLSLYTSGTTRCPSLREILRTEILRILGTYKDEALSFTVTGHSLGAALATLAAYDINTSFSNCPLVTVISFGGPRVGNHSFRCHLEKQGTKILRIVNPGDLITKIPGFVIDDHNHVNRHQDYSCSTGGNISGDDDLQGDHKKPPADPEVREANVMPIKMLKEQAIHTATAWLGWLQKRVGGTQWVYAEVGCELRLASHHESSSQGPPYAINNMNLAECHDLRTYLMLLGGFVSAKCPIKATARRLKRRKVNLVL